MRWSEIRVGESYAYSTSARHGTRLRFTVTGFEEGKVLSRGSYSSRRRAILVVGVLDRLGGAEGLYKTESRYLHGTWDAHLAEQQAAADALAAREARQAALTTAREPLLASLQARLLAVGGRPLQTWEQTEALRKGTVRLALEDVAKLLDL